MERIAPSNHTPDAAPMPDDVADTSCIAALPRDAQGCLTLTFAPPSRGKRMYAYEMTPETIREFMAAARPTR